MAKLNFLRRLIKEDFKRDDQELVGKIGSIYNPAFESIAQALTKNLNFTDNFDAQIKEFDVTVDSAGKPINDTGFQSDLKGSCKFMFCGYAENLTNSALYPTGAVQVFFSESADIITITHVTGLQANNKYRLRVLATS